MLVRRLCSHVVRILAMQMLVQTTIAADQPGVLVRSSVQADGALTMPSFDLPPSTYASQDYQQYVLSQFRASPGAEQATDLAARRHDVDSKFYGPKVERLARMYPFSSTKSTMGGVPIETFEPNSGIAPENRNRVLLNLHGGGFVFGGGGPGGAAESIPIAGLGRIRVIAVDYRLAPEHRFPAASEDLASV